jgi:hypothetical protein
MGKKDFIKSMVVITGLLLQINLWGQTVVTVNVQTAGTLGWFLGANYLNITDLTVTGNLNSDDIMIIRKMAGRDMFQNVTNGNLTNLNLDRADIVGGGHFYLASQDNYYSTTYNVISDYMFAACNLKSIAIPNSVYAINKNAFAYCEQLTSVTIGNSLGRIGTGAFYFCHNLIEIHSKNPIPPDILGANLYSYDGSDCLYFVPKTTCKLYVPKGSLAAYKNADGWKYFTNIIEETVTGINTINKDNITIQSISNGIAIETKEQMSVSVYNLAGQKVYQSVINGNVEIPLHKGVYIVSVNNESQKVIVK